MNNSPPAIWRIVLLVVSSTVMKMVIPRMVAAGVDSTVIRLIVWHSTTAIIDQRYSHLDPASLAAASRAIEVEATANLEPFREPAAHSNAGSLNLSRLDRRRRACGDVGQEVPHLHRPSALFPHTVS